MKKFDNYMDNYFISRDSLNRVLNPYDNPNYYYVFAFLNFRLWISKTRRKLNPYEVRGHSCYLYPRVDSNYRYDIYFRGSFDECRSFFFNCIKKFVNGSHSDIPLFDSYVFEVLQ